MLTSTQRSGPPSPFTVKLTWCVLPTKVCSSSLPSRTLPPHSYPSYSGLLSRKQGLELEQVFSPIPASEDESPPLWQHDPFELYYFLLFLRPCLMRPCHSSFSRISWPLYLSSLSSGILLPAHSWKNNRSYTQLRPNPDDAIKTFFERERKRWHSVEGS